MPVIQLFTIFEGCICSPFLLLLKPIKMSNKFRIVFSDVDGTLLNKNRELSSATVFQIRKLTQHNIPFVMVSARMPAGMIHLYREVPINNPAICYNGALILKSIEEEININNMLFSTTIGYSVAKSISGICQKFDLHFSLYTNNQWFASKNDEWRLREEINTKVKATIYSNMEYKISELENEQQHIHKLMIMGESMLIDALHNHLANQFTGKINMYRSKDTYIEITPASINKATGCLALLTHLNLKPEQAIAFGDNFNDTEMLQSVDFGVAMGNAPLEVKAKAQMVAPANTDDGVAKTLETIFKFS